MKRTSTFFIIKNTFIEEVTQCRDDDYSCSFRSLSAPAALRPERICKPLLADGFSSTPWVDDGEIIQYVWQHLPALEAQCNSTRPLPGWIASARTPQELALLPIPWNGELKKLKAYKDDLIHRHGRCEAAATSVSNLQAHRLLSIPVKNER